MSAILSAIGRGFTSSTIIRKLATNYPQYSNELLGLQAAGYSGHQILRKIYNKKTGKNLDEDSFLTEHEKTMKKDAQRKKTRALTTLGVLGAVGAGAAGAIHLAGRNAAIQPTQILPAIRGAQQGARQQPTINVGPRQIGNQQAQLPYHQKNLPGPIKGLYRPIGPIGPKPQPSQGPQAPIQGNNAPNVNPPINPVSSAMSIKDAFKNQRDPLQSIQLVKNLNLETRFQNAIKSGYDPETTSEILKMILPKEARVELEKVPGGLESIVEDYSKHLQSDQQNQQQQPEQQMQAPQVAQAPQQQMPLQQEQQQLPIEQNQVSNPREMNQVQPIEQELPSLQENRNEVAPLEEFEPETQGNLTMLPNGKMGQIESVKNGNATVNVDGKTKIFKEDALTKEPLGTEQAVRHLINSIPENLKSTSLQSAIHFNIEGKDVMLTQFYDGKIAWYLDVPESTYQQISLGTYKPKGQGITGIGEYNPGAIDSRGAGFHTEIKINPKYSKENKGKTWGYASNMYSLLHNIQPIIHKISKEKYDQEGNLIQPKPRKKAKD